MTNPQGEDLEAEEIVGMLTGAQKNGIGRLVSLFTHERDFAKAHGWEYDEARRWVRISRAMGIQLQDLGLSEFRWSSVQRKSFGAAPTDLGRRVATLLSQGK